jgi:hypothetical protein
MNKMLSQTARPVNQVEYQTGRLDGLRYYGEGHSELYSRYESGSSDYRLGFDAAKEEPRAIDPDFAS